MTTLSKHLAKMGKYVRQFEDEIHLMQQHGHIRDDELIFLDNLSDEVHTLRKGIDRTKLLLSETRK